MFDLDLGSAFTIIAGVFLATSPLTSYLDTVLTIHKRKTSAGFSVDICAIMLVSSICKVYFWLGRRYELSLFIQSIVMIAVQIVLLKLALQHRPRQWVHGPLDRDPDTTTTTQAALDQGIMKMPRPFGFWQWEQEQPYWRFLTQLCVGLGVMQMVVGWWTPYVEFLGMVGLLIEAVLPLPQILTIASRQSVDGFRPSLLVSWIGGDVAKLIFLTSGNVNVAPQMVVCALIQAGLDAYVGVQYYMYTTGKWSSTKQAQVLVSRQRAQSMKMQQRFSSSQVPHTDTIVEA